MPVLKVAALALAIGLVWTMAAAKGAMSARLPVALVVEGAVLTQPFGCTAVLLEPFDPYCPTRHFHSGVDLAAPMGSLVHAAAAGWAVKGYEEDGCGLFISVTVDPHARVLYCHLRRTSLAATDVSAGDVIGEVGSSGLATGPHVHLEVDVDGRAVDPIAWLRS
jgi:murein DD-endopeptidase MepM/ murein hydrolase activator NlpD